MCDYDNTSCHEQFRLRPVIVRQLGKDEFAIRPRGFGSPVVLRRAGLEALLACAKWTRCSDLRQHLDSAFSSSTETAVTLDDLLKQQFFLTQSSLLEAVRTAGKADNGAQIRRIGIPTKDRPSFLRRALASYADNTSRWDREAEFIVVDVSSSDSVAAQNQDECADTARHTQCTIHYAGPSSLRRWVAALHKHSEVPASIVEFALGLSLSAQRHLGPQGYAAHGGTRNCLLLETVDECFVSVDDDTVCATAEPLPQAGGMSVTSAPYPFNWTAGTSLPLPPSSYDFVGRHESVLGKRPSSIIAELDVHSLIIDGVSTDFAERLQDGGAVVTKSFVGLEGDCGISSPLGLALWNGHLCPTLINSESIYRNIIEGCPSGRWVASLTITDSPFCMCGNIGVDNRTTLPPFFPFLRNEDGLWGALVRALDEHRLTAFLPGTVKHDPPGRPPVPIDSAWRDVTRWRASDYLLHFILHVATSLRLPGHRRGLPAIGEDLVTLGSSSPSAFRSFLVDLRFEALTSMLHQLESTLGHRHGAAWWLRDLERFRSALRYALTSSDVIDMRDLIGSEADTLARLKDFTISYGLLLREWSSLRKASRHLKEIGNGPCLVLQPS